MTNVFFAALIVAVVESTNWVPVATVQNLQFRQAQLQAGHLTTNYIYEIQYSEGRIQWTNSVGGPAVAYRLIGLNDATVPALEFLTSKPVSGQPVPHPTISTPVLTR